MAKKKNENDPGKVGGGTDVLGAGEKTESKDAARPVASLGGEARLHRESSSEENSDESFTAKQRRILGFPVFEDRSTTGTVRRSKSQKSIIGITIVVAVVVSASLVMWLLSSLGKTDSTGKTIDNRSTVINVTNTDEFQYPRYPQNSLLDAPRTQSPKVLFLGPEEYYGKLHLEGLTHALAGTGIGVSTACRSSHKDLRPRQYDPAKLKALQDCVRKEIRSGDIIAVVGPCLVEETKPLLEAVLDVNPLLPVILESPIRRAQLGTSEKAFGAIKPGFPVYRISSGIDERGPQLSRLIRQIQNAQLKLAVVVEDSEYGESLERAIRDADQKLWESLMRAELQQVGVVVITSEISNADVLLYLGIGSQYKRLVKALDKKKFVIGLMNSWTFPDLYHDDPSVLQWLGDMEDIDSVDETRQSPQRAEFIKLGYQANAIHRDEMFSYDAGACIAEVYKLAADVAGGSALKTYRDLLVAMIKNLERPEGFRGASGGIVFPQRGGQNPSLEEGFSFVVPVQSAAVSGGVSLKGFDSVDLVKHIRAVVGR